MNKDVRSRETMSMPIDSSDSNAMNKAAARADRKKPYQPPQLIEWGRVADLTLGPAGGYEDAINGTQPF